GKYFTRELSNQLKEKFKQEGVKNMSVSVLDQLVEEGFEQGIEQGFEQGEVKRESKAILRTLNKRFKQVPKKIEKRLFSITNLEKLENLADFAYDCTTLAEFEKALK
ncbi:MAG: DUF4351 domain-containing protein, partial [Planctomycetaceae bacterium]|nr:DUF4351 domain-containing protein [Planctomycetaceae bacterium]